MSAFNAHRFLRTVLVADALSCVACGVLQVIFTGEMQSLLALPATLLMATGWFLVVYAAAVGWLASRKDVAAGFVWIVAAGNFAWTAGCVALVATAWATLSAWGVLWVLAQAATTLALGELQVMCLKRPGLRISA